VAPPAARPNIIIIFADDLGYGDIGVNGARGFTTPHIDGLARRGSLFSNFHVAQAVCSASRAALLTGCYPERVGIPGALGPQSALGLHADETTLAELLRACGYATGLVGKWHLGHLAPFLPPRHGFDESYGLPYSNDIWPYHPVDRPDAFRPPLPMIENGQVVDPEITPDEQALLTTWYTERAVDFISRHRAGPFFLYLAHSMPHVPLFVSERFRGQSERGLYGDVVMELDWSVGQITRALRDHGLEDNTLVIFTSDNGPSLSYGDHAGSAGGLREGKTTIWEGGTRVPCVMAWPGHVPAGTVNDRFLVTIDLLPTLAGLAGGGPLSLPIDGRDVWPLLVGQPGARNPHDAYGFWGRKNELHGVVTGDGRWKLVLPHDYNTLGGLPGGRDGKPASLSRAKITQPHLYDLLADREERHDVAVEHPEVMQRLQALAAGLRQELGDSLTGVVGRSNREPGRVSPALKP